VFVQVASYRATELEGVKLRGKNCPRPIKKWTQCGLPEKVYEVLKRSGFENPFPIQAQAMPAIMSGRDLIGCAKTGSGKTLAFVLPMLRHIMDQRPVEATEGPIGLLLTPTRELALQIHREVKPFASALRIRCACVYGGGSIADQIADLKRGAEAVVATPGRLIDMLCANNGKVLNLNRVSYLVLDEADRMFDMGFEPQINVVLNNTRPDRQSVMFSATFPPSIEKLARKTLKHRPLEIVVGGRSVVSSLVHQVFSKRSECFPLVFSSNIFYRRWLKCNTALKPNFCVCCNCWASSPTLVRRWSLWTRSTPAMLCICSC
jgi:ATP-dependent RNA helicase DDX46/PRP5